MNLSELETLAKAVIYVGFAGEGRESVLADITFDSSDEGRMPLGPDK